MRAYKIALKSIFALIVLLLTVIFLISITGSNGEEVKPEHTYRIVPSYNPGFYPHDLSLSLYILNEDDEVVDDKDLEILYTMTNHNARTPQKGELITKTGEVYMFSGGKEPDYEYMDFAGIRKTYKYTKSIDVINTSNNFPRVVVVRAAIFADGKKHGRTQTYTYIIGTGIEDFAEHFGAMVVCITTDEKKLYGYEEGIMIKGATYDFTKTNNPQRDEDWWYPKNYNQRGRQWEREAHVAFFESDGTLVLSQNCGIRTAGGTSRNALIKSLKLIARREYSEHTGTFDYEFFDDLRDHYGNRVKSFERLVLRNSVNDDGGSMIRDQLINDLGAYAGVDHQAGRPCVVYLNGKYYSMMTLKQSLDNDNIETRYHINKDTLAIITIQSDFFQFRYRLESGTEEDFNAYIKDMRKLINTNYANKDISEMEEIIDVDNFIKYMAFQIYIVNPDWPHNNVMAWKYTGPVNESVYGMDGKWRFVLRDLDFGFRDPSRNMFETVMSGGLYNNEPHLGQVLKNLLRNKEFNRRFKEYMTKLCTEILTEEVLTEYILNAKEERVQDMKMYRFYFGGSDLQWNNLINEFLDFAKQRNRHVLNQLKKLP